jgi:hypothetical protein
VIAQPNRLLLLSDQNAYTDQRSRPNPGGAKRNEGVSWVESHDGSQSETRCDDEHERFVSHFCELTGQLGKFERWSEAIGDDP